MPVIRDHLEEVIFSTWGPGDESEILSYVGDIPLTRQDFRTLSYPKAPNAKIIDCYLSLVVDRRTSMQFPSVFAFNSFFQSALSTKRSCRAMSWIKKLNIFSYDLIFVPLYYTGSWTLLVVNNYSKSIHLYRDSDAVGKKCVDKVLHYFKNELLMKHQEYKFTSGMDFLQHRDERDASLYFLVLVEYLSRNATLAFTQKHMPYFRRKLTYELRTGQICMTHSMLFYGIENTKVPANVASEEQNQIEQRVVCIIRHIQLTCQDFFCLEDHNWLNHSIIDGYMTLLVDRSLAEGRPTLCACSSNAIEYLMQISAGAVPLPPHKDRTTEVGCDILFVPVLHERHWSLIAVDNRQREIQYYNSASDQIFPFLPSFKTYLKFLMPSRQAITSTYTMKTMSECPQQKESNDSGVFLLMFAEHIAQGAQLAFDHNHVPYYRKKIGFEFGLRSSAACKAAELLQQSGDYEVCKEESEAVAPVASPEEIHTEPEFPVDPAQHNEKEGCDGATNSVASKELETPGQRIASSVSPNSSEEFSTVVHSTWKACEENVMSVINGTTLSRKNFLTLMDNSAPDFQIVDTYINLLVQRSCSQEGFLSVHNFAAAFTKIIATPNPTVPSETDVCLFSFDLALCPIKFKQFWALVVIDNRARKILHYNLLPEISVAITEVLRRYVANEAQRKEVKDFKDYSVEPIKGILPGEHCDSGIFVLAIAEYLSRGAYLSISRKLVPYFRRKITYELLTATILTHPVPPEKQTRQTNEERASSLNTADIHPREMPPITKKMDAIILTSQGLENKRQILCKIGHIWLTRMDFLSLQSRHWLSNEVVNSYMTLIVERGRLDGFPTVFALNSEFGEILRTRGPKRMTFSDEVCIFTYDLIIIPMNLKDFWTLVVIDNKCKKVRMYHKMCDAMYEVITGVREYLHASGQKMRGESPNINEYVTETARNLPELGSSYENKLSVLIFAEYVTRKACIKLRKEFVPYFRKKIAYELRTGKLLEIISENVVPPKAVAPAPEPPSTDDPELLIPIHGESKSEESFRVVPHSKRKAPKMVLVRSFKKLKLVKQDIFVLNSADSALSPALVFCYLLLIHERSLEDKNPSVYPFPPSFYDTLVTKKKSLTLAEYSKDMDLFTYDLLLVPACVSGHWFLLVVDNRCDHIQYYDSGGHPGLKPMKLLSTYLAGKVKEKSRDWSLETVQGLPQQEKDTDSGVLMLLCAECVTRDAEVTLNQNNLKYYRKKMSLELLYIELNRASK